MEALVCFNHHAGNNSLGETQTKENAAFQSCFRLNSSPNYPARSTTSGLEHEYRLCRKTYDLILLHRWFGICSSLTPGTVAVIYSLTTTPDNARVIRKVVGVTQLFQLLKSNNAKATFLD